MKEQNIQNVVTAVDIPEFDKTNFQMIGIKLGCVIL